MSKDRIPPPIMRTTYNVGRSAPAGRQRDFIEATEALTAARPVCRCPREPQHKATVAVAVYPVLASGEIAQAAVAALSMPVCVAVVDAYRQAIRDGLLRARIDVSSL